MDELTLVRDKFLKSGIFGILSDLKNIMHLQTLEHAYFNTENGNYEPKIPVGRYKCVLYNSPHFGYYVFVLVGVPNHEYCEIHKGNWNADSDGCILIGKQLGHMNDGGLMLMQSKEAFDEFMTVQKPLAEFWLTVETKIV